MSPTVLGNESPRGVASGHSSFEALAGSTVIADGAGRGN
jgi:hypothetical protein